MNGNKAYRMISISVILVILSVGVNAASYDFSCETPVIVSEQFDGEAKYTCAVKNTGDSFLKLRYDVQPEQNPINPGLAVGFHPQPSAIYLEAGETQLIAGFEVPPRVPPGQSEISYNRVITVHPLEGKVESKEVTLTTIVKNLPLNDNAKVFGKILDAQTGQPIRDAEVFFKYKRFERRINGNGEYAADLPALHYLMMVDANGYELFSKEVSPAAGEELSIDVHLIKAAEKGTYNLVKELRLESGAWEGVWRSASNDEFIALGMGGYRLKMDNFESYFYIFETSGKQLLKVKTVDEVRGIDIYDNLIAVGLGAGDNSEIERVMLFNNDGELIWKKFITNIPFHEVKFSHDGRFLAVGDTEGYVYLLDASDGKEIWKKFTRGQVRAIRFYDDDSHLLAGSGDDHVYLFDIDGNQKWRTYVHSWSYGFIAATPGNEFSAAGGHLGFLHLLGKNGKDVWAYEADGGFRWAEIDPKASFVVGGTRSELAFLDIKGNVLWKGYDSVSGAMTPDGKYILSGNQRGELELRNANGTILWEHRTQRMEPGIDMRLAFISDDATLIVGAAKTGDVYFFKGGVSHNEQSIVAASAKESRETDTPPRLPPQPEKSFQSNVVWIIAGILLLVMIVLYVKRILYVKRK